ncbi:MAG: DUF4197 family protein, partial [Mucilaginibacter sp.]
MKRAFLLFTLLLLSMVLSSFDHAKAQTIPSSLEMGSALKQALQQGTAKSSDELSAVNGFFGNPSVKILFPPEAKKVEST